MLSRREFLGAVAVSVIQQTQTAKPDGARPTMVMPMDDDAYKLVVLPPRVGAGPSMLVRPDACVAWMGDGDGLDGLDEALRRWFRPARG